MIKSTFKNFLTELENFLKKNIKDKSPIVVYSSIWQPCVCFKITPKKFSNSIIRILLKISKKNTVFMPSFIKTKKKTINLNIEPSVSGYLTNQFMNINKVKRTLCPIFPFAVLGNDCNYFKSLTPIEVWGENSVTEYLYKNNAYIFTLGTHPTECSLSHYAEWLNREKIHYRQIKIKKFKLIYNKKHYNITKKLFVRKKGINYNFKKFYKTELKNGMKTKKIGEVMVSISNAKKKIDIIKNRLRKNPKYLI